MAFQPLPQRVRTPLPVRRPCGVRAPSNGRFLSSERRPLMYLVRRLSLWIGAFVAFAAAAAASWRLH
jgi:hypothetical protein